MKQDFLTAKQAIEYFVKMQSDIMGVINKLNKLYESNEEIRAARLEYETLMDKYKSESKAYFGFSDGESLNVVQIASLVTKMQEQQ